MKNRYIFENYRESIQLAYGIVLVILIPVLIVFNTLFIINKYNRGMDVALQKQALTVARTISILIKSDLPWEYFVQAKLDMLMENNTEILEIQVLRPEGDDFRIAASSRPENVNRTSSSYYYKLAWLQPLNDALATDSLKLEETHGAELVEANEQTRYWLVTMPMADAEGGKQALLSVKLSSEIVGQLTAYNRNASVAILVGTVIVVILFLLIAVRLWDYAILYKKIKDIDKMKDDFISMASHELRTPVTAIRGYASMINDGSMGEVGSDVKHGAGLIRHSAERLMALVEDLLDVSRIEQGRLRFESRPLNPNQIIREVLDELKVQAQIKNIELVYQPYTERLPAINVDPERFRQVLINLVGNAIKYTFRGAVDIEVGETKRNRVFEIRVKDTGIGISGKDQPRLFEKFYRVKNAKTEQITGTGLGLWITGQIIEKMGGKIEIESIENVGTQVKVQFPIINQ